MFLEAFIRISGFEGQEKRFLKANSMILVWDHLISVSQCYFSYQEGEYILEDAASSLDFSFKTPLTNVVIMNGSFPSKAYAYEEILNHGLRYFSFSSLFAQFNAYPFASICPIMAEPPKVFSWSENREYRRIAYISQ